MSREIVHCRLGAIPLANEMLESLDHCHILLRQVLAHLVDLLVIFEIESRVGSHNFAQVAALWHGEMGLIVDSNRRDALLLHHIALETHLAWPLLSTDRDL